MIARYLSLSHFVFDFFFCSTSLMSCQIRAHYDRMVDAQRRDADQLLAKLQADLSKRAEAFVSLERRHEAEQRQVRLAMSEWQEECEVLCFPLLFRVFLLILLRCQKRVEARYDAQVKELESKLLQVLEGSDTCSHGVIVFPPTLRACRTTARTCTAPRNGNHDRFHGSFRCPGRKNTGRAKRVVTRAWRSVISPSRGRGKPAAGKSLCLWFAQLKLVASHECCCSKSKAQQPNYASFGLSWTVMQQKLCSFCRHWNPKSQSRCVERLSLSLSLLFFLSCSLFLTFQLNNLSCVP